MGKSLDIIKAPKQKDVTPRTIGDNGRERDKDRFFDTERNQEHSDPLLFYLILGLCAIILLVALSVWLIYKSFNSTSQEDTTTTEETQETVKSKSEDGATITETTTTDTTTTTSEAPETTEDTPTATSEIDKASVKLRIVNGNGRSGEAGLMKTALEDDGFTNISTGNALSQYSTTVVYYNTGKIAEAKAVDAIVSQKYETSLLEDPSITKDNDVVVALGAK